MKVKRGREWERELGKNHVELFASITGPQIILYLRQVLTFAGLGEKQTRWYFWNKAKIKCIFGIR